MPALTTYRCLAAIVYVRTQSLPIARAMQASFVASQAKMVPVLLPESFFIWYGPFVVVLWILAVAVTASKWV